MPRDLDKIMDQVLEKARIRAKVSGKPMTKSTRPRLWLETLPKAERELLEQKKAEILKSVRTHMKIYKERGEAGLKEALEQEVKKM